MSDKTDHVNVTKSGDQYRATVTKYFDTQEEAANWGDQMLPYETPEKAASDMTVEEAEEINANVRTTTPPQSESASVSAD